MDPLYDVFSKSPLHNRHCAIFYYSTGKKWEQIWTERERTDGNTLFGSWFIQTVHGMKYKDTVLFVEDELLGRFYKSTVYLNNNWYRQYQYSATYTLLSLLQVQYTRTLYCFLRTTESLRATDVCIIFQLLFVLSDTTSSTLLFVDKDHSFSW